MNISREQLKGSYSEGEAMDTYRKLQASGDFITFAHAFIYDEDYQVARNALWVLTKSSSKEMSTLQPMMQEFIDLALSTGNSSVRRLSLHAVERLSLTEEFLTTEFLDFCLDHMVDPNEYPGIQTLCMKIGLRLSRFYPELHEEFIRSVESIEVEYYKPAVRCLRQRILSGKYK